MEQRDAADVADVPPAVQRVAAGVADVQRSAAREADVPPAEQRDAAGEADAPLP